VVTTPTPPKLAFWAWLHFAFLVLGAVGLCVGFIASVMYLVQSWKLKHKQVPGEGLRLLSLERLEEMNRRGIALAFPLLTAGLLIGVILLWSTEQLSWLDPKVVSTIALWLVFVVLLYLRYALHLRGRRVAWWTIAAFGFLVLAFLVHFILPSGHHFGGGA
jgi:ABC-type transport system involved in cytochrome c biogenesis permease subunit